ncbi:hypothetical protein J7E45_16065 [Microbacterium sp. ISL-59]|uniref:hypothetical protein n=1 Tax=Microbacterium sp. ISL-59 TaxID=2819159 RepID=UPI001BE539B7|nr:hypothetical protein [Microbacterium sp. ISL-59]MBT2497128.1 hypothetical protein [Microbacterium sp. ISL-59]
MARRKSTVSAPTGISPAYQHLHERALAAIAEYDDPRRMEQHRVLVAEGIARPLDDLLRFHRERAEACEREEPITVSRFELSRWFKDLPEGVWSFTLHADGTGNAHPRPEGATHPHIR